MAATIRCPSCAKLNRVAPVARGVPRCAVCHAPLPWIVEADEQGFAAETTASVPVLVDFWAPWCGPCRMVSPLLERLARERAGHLKLVKLNVDEAPATASRFGVKGIPTLVLLRAGAELDRLVGAAPEGQLQAFVDAHLAPSASAGAS